MKIATTLDEQINRLQERGMTISNCEKAREILLDIGYYRLGFYWFNFEKSYPEKINRTHYFIAGTRFEQVVDLYYFDQDLRNTLAPYLYRIEINFRTFLIYTVSNFYRHDPTWFSNPEYIEPSFSEHLRLCYNTIKKNDVIRLHHKKYKCAYAPAWKTIEYMTFGDLLKLFSCLKNQKLKQEISLHYDIHNPQVFFNFMNTIRVIRNLCAHGHNLYDLKLQKSIKTGPLQNMSEEMHHNLSGGLKVISYILHRISANREQELHDRIADLLHQPQVRSLTCTQHIII